MHYFCQRVIQMTCAVGNTKRIPHGHQKDINGNFSWEKSNRKGKWSRNFNMEEDVEIKSAEGNIGTDFTVNLVFKLSKEARSFNCAALHRKWFGIVKRIDEDAKIIIAVNNTAISNIKQFCKDQQGYNKTFLQRISRPPGAGNRCSVRNENVKEVSGVKTDNLE